MDIEQIDFGDLEFIENGDHFVVKRAKQFFRLGKLEGNMLRDLKEKGNIPQILSTYNIKEEDLEGFIMQLESAGVIGTEKTEHKNILFYKVSLFNPDRFLDSLVKNLFHYTYVNNFLILLLGLIILLGFVLFFNNFNDITTNLLIDFVLSDFALFYISTITTVFLHEIGHAVTCKYYGGKVEEIGFLLLFFSPALYCDVSGIRMFSKKKEKVITLLAGVFVQLIIFSLVSILYHYFFWGSSFLATFAIWNLLMIVSNIIPVIKLDGYWILSSVLDIPNLYEKSLKLVLGNQEGVLFNEREIRMKKFVKIFGIMNILFVFISAFMGLFGIYFMSTRLEGIYKYISITINTLIYLLILIFFTRFLIKMMKHKFSTQRA